MPEPSPNGRRRTPLHITKSITFDANTGLLTFEWKDDERTVFNLGDLPVEQQTALMYWGCISRIQQGYVMAKGSPVVAREKAGKLWEQLKRGEGLGRAEKSVSIVVAALARLLNIPEGEAQARFSALPVEKRREVSNRNDVVATVAKIKAETAPATARLADILK